jgi:hypothetical protein
MSNGTTSLLNLSQAAQALALVGEGIGVAKKKGKEAKDILGLGIKNIVGTRLIREQGRIISTI